MDHEIDAEIHASVGDSAHVGGDLQAELFLVLVFGRTDSIPAGADDRPDGVVQVLRHHRQAYRLLGG